MTINYAKRTAEQTAIIKRIAATLPAGQKNSLLNAAGKLELLARKEIEIPVQKQPAQDAILDHYASTKAIVSALLAGRKLSFLDMREFNTCEFHSRICDAKKIILRQYPQYDFHADWTYDMKHPYKTYYLTF